jgi:uncharacterized phage protein gp47/JayE
MIRAIALAVAMAACAASAQQMYKWVDEKGVTHFSETPPPDGNKGATKIEVKPGGSEKPGADNWRQRDLESRQRRAKEGVEEESAKRAEESQRAGRCSEAQRQVDGFTNNVRVYHLDEKGQRVYLDEKQRETELARWRQDVEKYCR